MTDIKEENVLWSPLPRQELFLSAPEEEVLYGGGVGGGKTDALVIDALGLTQNAISVSRYRALILRRTFPELAEIIDRAKIIYPQISECTYNSSNHEFRFASGAKIKFGYGQTIDDALQYQGQEYQYIGFEELTQWKTPEVYMFLKSRLRGTNLKKYMRSTCNPGGAGGRWVQEYFNIPDDGTESRCEETHNINGKEIKIRKRFIPARLSDNPYLSDEYRANLMSMKESDKKALLDGRWDCYEVEGSIYKNEVEDLKQNRLMKVPYDPNVPVHVAWDLGISDSTSLVFAQVVGREIHIINHYENNGKSLLHYCDYIKSFNYRLGDMLLPHDAFARELGTGKTREELIRQNGLSIKRVPMISVEDGIEATKNLLLKSYFDIDNTKRLVECITNYRREYNRKMNTYEKPLHDDFSHSCDSLRYLAVGLKEQTGIRTLDMKKIKTLNISKNNFSTGWMS